MKLACRQCGLEFEFERPPGQRGRNPVTCSEKCRAERQRAANRASPPSPRRKMARQCVICGTDFETTCSRTVTCSKTCGSTLSNRSRRLRVAHERLRACESCGAPFIANPPSGKVQRGEVREGRFCSRKCHGAAQRKAAAAKRAAASCQAKLPL